MKQNLESKICDRFYFSWTSCFAATVQAFSVGILITLVILALKKTGVLKVDLIQEINGLNDSSVSLIYLFSLKYRLNALYLKNNIKGILNQTTIFNWYSSYILNTSSILLLLMLKIIFVDYLKQCMCFNFHKINRAKLKLIIILLKLIFVIFVVL